MTDTMIEKAPLILAGKGYELLIAPDAEVRKQQLIEAAARVTMVTDNDESADAQFVFETERQYFADLGEHGVKIADLLGDELETVIGTVERQRFAAPINDPATPRRNEAQLHPVLLGRQAILFALKD